LSWAKIALLPATLYAVQNLAALTAYQNLDALTFNVLNQTKTLSAALCCYLVMGRTQSNLQVVALVILIVSSLIVEGILPLDSIVDVFTQNKAKGQSILNPGIRTQETTSRHITHGVMPILLASFISGLTGALSQKSLQALNGGRDPYLFSLELCLGSILVLMCSLAVSNDGKSMLENGFFSGWTVYTCIPVITNSFGGIVVGLVTKYAGSVRKGFSLIFGLLFSGKKVQEY
jgi:UDP-sugar transporter A1/2/3